MKKEEGITLIALVITIIVLLILAGVSIAMLTGENGILTQAQKASEQTEIGKEKEQIALAYNGVKTKKEGGDVTSGELDAELKANGADATATGTNPITVTFNDSKRSYTIDANGNILEAGTGTTGGEETIGTLDTLAKNPADKNTTVQDTLGNKVVIPAGFIVGNPEANVEDGIYIIDQSHTNTAGSEFVWIPVGTVHRKNKEDITITLGRYVFNSDGSINTELSKTQPEEQLKTSSDASYYFTEGTKDSTTENTHAKDITTFISKVNSTGGYYIGRYEARTATPRSSENDSLTQITVKPNENVYNYVTQSQAASLSQNMYNETNPFTSDLMNSYAWDTAIEFIQNCSGDSDYSQQSSLNIGSLAPTGTKDDVKCNVYDMASNCLEWLTETCSGYFNYSCVVRGGTYDISSSYTAFRTSTIASTSLDYNAFRPLLYL